MSFNWVDALLVLLIGLSIWNGYRRGFILSFLDFARWIGSLLAGLFLYRAVAEWLAPLTGWDEMWNQPLAFVLLAVLAGIAIAAAGAWALRRIPRRAHENSLNKIFGIVPGAASGLITAAIFAALLFSMPFSDRLAESAQNSRLADNLAAYADQLETQLTPIFAEPLRQTLQRRAPIEPGENERVELPFKVENARPRPDLEAEMLVLVNRERAANNLPPLEADPEMTMVARKHSADMFARGYFAHNTPKGVDPFERMRADNVRYRTAGENLALAPTLQIAHTGLMNSPGHRANILRASFGRVGIGILDGGRHGIMVSQEFRN